MPHYDVIVHRWPIGVVQLAAVERQENFSTHRAFRYFYIVTTPRPFDLYAAPSKSNFVAHVQAGDQFAFENPVPLTDLFFDYPAYNGKDALDYNSMVMWISDTQLDRAQIRDYPRLWSFERRTGLTIQPFAGTYDGSPHVIVNVPSLTYYSIDNEREIRAWCSAASPNITGQNVAAVALFTAAGVPITTLPVSGSVTAQTVKQKTFGLVVGKTGTAFASGTNTPILSWYHLVGSTRRARLWSIDVAIHDSSAASVLFFFLQRLDGSTAPSGGTLETVAPYNPADTEEVVIRSYPTAGSTVGGLLAGIYDELGITAADPTLNPPPTITKIPILPPRGPDSDAPTARAGTAEGWMLYLRVVGAATINLSMNVQWTEE